MMRSDRGEGQAGPGAENTSEEWDRLRALTESMTPSERAFMDVVSGIKPGGRLTFLGSKSAAILLSFRAALRASEAALAVQRRNCDNLADEVGVLIRRKIIDSRSPAADALLDFREPPSSERADRLATVEIALAERTKERDEEREERMRVIGQRDTAWSKLAEAANEINCAGSVAHRIRIMKAEHGKALEAARVERDEALALLSQAKMEANIAILKAEQGREAAREERDIATAALAEASFHAGRRDLFQSERSFTNGWRAGVTASFDLLGERKDERVMVLNQRAAEEERASMFAYDAGRIADLEKALASMTKERDARPSWGRVAEMVEAARAEATKAEDLLRAARERLAEDPHCPVRLARLVAVGQMRALISEDKRWVVFECKCGKWESPIPHDAYVNLDTLAAIRAPRQHVHTYDCSGNLGGVDCPSSPPPPSEPVAEDWLERLIIAQRELPSSVADIIKRAANERRRRKGEP